MDRKAHLESWDQMRTRHGITLRLIDQIPEDQLKRHPIAGMRTPLELVVHMYAQTESLVDSALTGSCGTPDEAAVVGSIANRAGLLEYVNRQWESADRKARKVTDAQLAGMVKTPWGDPFPGAAMLGFVHDEYLHHRGQLYAFIRTYGIEPVMLWDLEHNAPEYRPKETAKA